MASDSDYVLVFNIPNEYHSSDLRVFFSEFIENQKCFSCFHFRHRPQTDIVKSVVFETVLSGKNSKPTETKFFSENPVCCIVKCSSNAATLELIEKYHFHNWVGASEQMLSTRCFVAEVKFSEHMTTPLTSLTVTVGRLEVFLSKKKVESLPELHPPGLMPRGNVGTATQHFLDLIKACQLPSKLIGKLGLNFPKAKHRRYGSVPFNYQSSNPSGICFNDHKLHQIKANKIRTASSDNSKKHEEEEEWDRHEALHDDVTEQERCKERLYEEEEEVVWEKGGPGIVWYTDAQKWKEAEGDFDEQTTDDWDFDYSVYSEENGGDKDARDAVEMRRSEMWRLGKVESVFKKPPPPKPGHRKVSRKSGGIGLFEQHTRGIGRRLMEKQGWRDGLGLGLSEKGIPKPIESDGQKPMERKGLGYYGEQLPRFGAKECRRKRGVIISTVYDSPAITDPPEQLLQRNPSTYIKHRRM